jgi:Ser/Thr protein kinase RdoA (MazF antagonist)
MEDQRMIEGIRMRAEVPRDSGHWRTYGFVYDAEGNPPGSDSFDIYEMNDHGVIPGQKNDRFMLIAPLEGNSYRDASGRFAIQLQQFHISDPLEQRRGIFSGFIAQLPPGTRLKLSNIMNGSTLETMKNKYFERLAALHAAKIWEKHVKTLKDRILIMHDLLSTIQKNSALLSVDLQELFLTTPFAKSIEKTGYINPRLEVEGGRKEGGVLQPYLLNYYAEKPGRGMERWRAAVPSELAAKIALCGPMGTAGQFRSEVRFQIPEGATVNAVVDRHDVLGDVVNLKDLKLDQQQKKQLFRELYRLEEEIFGTRMQDDWKRWFEDRNFRVYGLVRDRQITGAVVGEIYPNGTTVRMGPLMTREDPFQGKGPFLMDCFLSRMRDEGRLKIIWTSVKGSQKKDTQRKSAPEFYDGYVASRERAGILERIPREFSLEYAVELIADPLGPRNPNFDHFRKPFGARGAGETKAEPRSEARTRLPVPVPANIDPAKKIAHVIILSDFDGIWRLNSGEPLDPKVVRLFQDHLATGRAHLAVISGSPAVALVKDPLPWQREGEPLGNLVAGLFPDPKQGVTVYGYTGGQEYDRETGQGKFAVPVYEDVQAFAISKILLGAYVEEVLMKQLKDPGLIAAARALIVRVQQTSFDPSFKEVGSRLMVWEPVMSLIRAQINPSVWFLDRGTEIEIGNRDPQLNFFAMGQKVRQGIKSEPSLSSLKEEDLGYFSESHCTKITRSTKYRAAVSFRDKVLDSLTRELPLKEDEQVLVVGLGDANIDVPMYRASNLAFHMGEASHVGGSGLDSVVLVRGSEGSERQKVQGAAMVLDNLFAALGKPFREFKYFQTEDPSGAWTWKSLQDLNTLFPGRSEAREGIPPEVSIDRNLLGKILSGYGIAQFQAVAVKDKPNVMIVGGTEKGDFVLKRPRFRNVPSYIEWEAAVLDRLHQNGLRVARIQRASDEKPYVKVGDSYFVLYEKLEGKNDYGWGDVDGEPLIAAAKVLAQIHQALKDFEPAQQNYILEDLPQVFPVNAVEHGLKKIEALYDQIEARAPPDRSDTDQIFWNHREQINQWVEKLRKKLEAASLRDLPETLVQGDFQQSNMFFQDDGGIALTDFEYAHRDKRVFDLANALIIRLRDRDPKDLSSMDMDKIERFVGAYDDALPAGEKLTPKEIELLPYVYALGYLEGVFVFAGMVREYKLTTPLLEQLANLDVLAHGGIEALLRRLQARLTRSEARRSEVRGKISDEELAAEEARLREVVMKMGSGGFWFGFKFGKAGGNSTSLPIDVARERIVDTLMWASHTIEFLPPADEEVYRAIITAMNEALCLEKIAGKGDMDSKAQELYQRIKDLPSQDRTAILDEISRFQAEQALPKEEPQPLKEDFKTEALEILKAQNWNSLKNEAKLEIDGERYVDLGHPDIQARLKEKAIIIQDPKRVFTRYTDEKFLEESAEWYGMRKTGARERRIMVTLEKNKVVIKFVKKKWEGPGYVVKDFLLDTIGYEKVDKNLLIDKYGFSEQLADRLLGDAESAYAVAIPTHPDPDRSNFRLSIYIPKGKTNVSDAKAELDGGVDLESRSEVRAENRSGFQIGGWGMKMDFTGVVTTASTKGAEAVRAELRAQGQAELGKTFDERIAQFREELGRYGTAREIASFILSSKFQERLTTLLGEFGDAAELVSRIRNRVVFGEEYQSSERLADNASRLEIGKVARDQALLDAAAAGLVMNGKEPSFVLLMDRPGDGIAEEVLKMLATLKPSRLIVYSAPGEKAFGRQWNSVAPVMPLRSKSAVQRAVNASSDLIVSFWTKNRGMDDLGVYSVLAEIGRIADPRLRELALTAVRIALLRFATLDKVDQLKVLAKPSTIRGYLEQFGIPSFIQFGSKGLIFNIERLVEEYTARQSVAQAA